MATDRFQSAVFYEYLEKAGAHAGRYLSGLPDRNVSARASREELLTALRVPLPQQGDAGGEIIELLAENAEQGAMA